MLAGDEVGLQIHDGTVESPIRRETSAGSVPWKLVRMDLPLGESTTATASWY